MPSKPFWSGTILLALLFLAPRLVDLGTVLTVDEPLWRARAHQFVEGITTFQPSRTFVSGHPGVTAMWLAGLALPARSLAASQAAIALGTSALLLLALGLFARLTSPRVAFAGGVIMALDPFLIAHSRVVHTDALLSAFMLLAFLALACAWRTGERRYWTYAAVSAAGAGLTKIFGLFLLAPLLIGALASPNRQGFSRPRAVLRRIGWLALPFALTFLIAWPALLFTPQTAIRFVAQRVTLHSQSAPVGSGGGDPWYYPREFLRRLSPAVTVLLPVVAIGLAFGSGKRLPHFPARGALAALLGTSLLYAALLSFSEQKSDRYILVAHLVTDIAAGASLVWLGALVTRSAPRWRILLTTGLVSIAGGFLARDVRAIHPYAMAHWNRLLPIPADAKLGWGEGLEEAAAYLYSLNLPTSELTTASYYPGVLAHFLPGVRVERFTQYESPDFRFVVLYRSMYGRDPGSYETVALRKFLGDTSQEGMVREVDGIPFRLEKVIWVDRLPFVWVFRRLATSP